MFMVLKRDRLYKTGKVVLERYKKNPILLPPKDP
jgi:hypothetical protein